MKLGSLLILVGIAFLAIGTFAPGLATVIYEPPDMITYVIPSGTAASPTAVAHGQAVTLQCDVHSGNGPSVLSVSANPPNLYGETTILTYNGITDPYGGAEFVGQWVVPNTLTGTVKFTFTSVDSANQQTVTYDVYVSSAATLPTGYFTINGQTVTQSSKVSVSSPNLQFDGYVSSGQAGVQNMRVVVQDASGIQLASLTLNLATGNHYGPQNFTLPTYGTYTVMGYIIGNGINVPVMSLFAVWGTSSPISTALWFQIIGAIFVVVGFILRRGH